MADPPPIPAQILTAALMISSDSASTAATCFPHRSAWSKIRTQTKTKTMNVENKRKRVIPYLLPHARGCCFSFLLLCLHPTLVRHHGEAQAWPAAAGLCREIAGTRHAWGAYRRA